MKTKTREVFTQGGWKSDRTAMRYIRRREGWETTAATKLGL